jgi:hypothetical protein
MEDAHASKSLKHKNQNYDFVFSDRNSLVTIFVLFEIGFQSALKQKARIHNKKSRQSQDFHYNVQ